MQDTMRIEEVKQNIYPEDRMMVAVNCECSYEMVTNVINNSRNANTELGKKIVAGLTKLAKINIAAKRKKTAAFQQSQTA